MTYKDFIDELKRVAPKYEWETSGRIRSKRGEFGRCCPITAVAGDLNPHNYLHFCNPLYAAENIGLEESIAIAIVDAADNPKDNWTNPDWDDTIRIELLKAIKGEI